MKDFSICIASRGDTLGLWATVHSVFDQLKDSGYDFEFCVCVNGEGERRKKDRYLHAIACPDTERTLHFLHKAGLAGHCTVMQQSVAPPTARQIAATKANGRILFFFDNHCLVAKDYFVRALETFQYHDVDLLHSATKFFEGEDMTYEYYLTLEHNFWAKPGLTPFHSSAPYAVAAAGHGGFAVRKSVWDEVGGYWTGFDGYGGEELTTDLQLWMRGYRVLLDPLMIHYHWAGRRPYARHFTAEYYRNMMMSANILGGETWLYKVYESFFKNYPHMVRDPLYDLLVEAYYLSRDYAKEVQSNSLRSLDEQLAYFRQFEIPH